MRECSRTVFSFIEPDHLIRIHVRMELEDVGFTVAEHGLDLSIEDDGAPGRGPAPMPMEAPPTGTDG